MRLRGTDAKLESVERVRALCGCSCATAPAISRARVKEGQCGPGPRPGPGARVPVQGADMCAVARGAAGRAEKGEEGVARCGCD